MKFYIYLKPALFVFFFSLTVLPEIANAQLQRERVQTDEWIEDVFWAPTNIGMGTVKNISKNNINTTILHTFGLIRGGIDRFFGMDDGANTRIGLDYGISDRLSAGIGRMTFNKIVDVRGKYNILRQTRSGSMPVELAVKTSVGINTTSGIGLEFSDRLSYFTSLMIAKKMNQLSIQITPMTAFYNRVAQNNPDQLWGVGFLFNYELNDRFSISGEYLPVIGDRHPSTADAAGLALNIYTGGHIFQIFLTTSQWHNEPFILANNRHLFWEGDFRFGFNIHRIFGLGG